MCWFYFWQLPARLSMFQIPETYLYLKRGVNSKLPSMVPPLEGEAQMGYAISDNVAVTGNYAFGSQKQTNSGDDQEFTRKNSYGELGLGLYKVKRNSRVELFAGYGIGKGTTHDQYYFFGLNNDVVATGKYNRIFIQPSIGTNNRKFNIAFTPRFSMMKFTEFTTDDTRATVAKFSPPDKFQLFIEPTVTGKFHLTGNVHGIFQLGLAIPTSGDEIYYEYMPAQFAVGLQIDTSNRLRTRVYK
jgi:hypothetical protein